MGVSLPTSDEKYGFNLISGVRTRPPSFFQESNSKALKGSPESFPVGSGPPVLLQEKGYTGFDRDARSKQHEMKIKAGSRRRSRSEWFSFVCCGRTATAYKTEPFREDIRILTRGGDQEIYCPKRLPSSHIQRRPLSLDRAVARTI
jgi:hypothetical protein